MGFKCLVMFCWFFVGLVFIVTCDAAAEEVTVKLLKTPRAITNQNAAKFAFEILVGSNGNACTNCTTNCKVICFIYILISFVNSPIKSDSYQFRDFTD